MSNKRFIVSLILSTTLLVGLTGCTQSNTDTSIESTGYTNVEEAAMEEQGVIDNYNSKLLAEALSVSNYSSNEFDSILQVINTFNMGECRSMELTDSNTTYWLNITSSDGTAYQFNVAPSDTKNYVVYSVTNLSNNNTISLDVYSTFIQSEYENTDTFPDEQELINQNTKALVYEALGFKEDDGDKAEGILTTLYSLDNGRIIAVTLSEEENSLYIFTDDASQYRLSFTSDYQVNEIENLKDSNWVDVTQ